MFRTDTGVPERYRTVPKPWTCRLDQVKSPDCHTIGAHALNRSRQAIAKKELDFPDSEALHQSERKSPAKKILVTKVISLRFGFNE